MSIFGAVSVVLLGGGISVSVQSRKQQPFCPRLDGLLCGLNYRVDLGLFSVLVHLLRLV